MSPRTKIEISLRATGRLFEALATLWIAGSWTQNVSAIVLGDAPLDDNPNLEVVAPVDQLKSTDDIILSRSEYVIDWSSERNVLNWAAWKLTPQDIGTTPRSKKFTVDPDLREYLVGQGQDAIGPKDYTGTCFDRGHQVPSADRTANQGMNQKTFFMSNILPQTPWLNRGPWKQMEFEIRKLVLEQGRTVYLVAGPIYSELDYRIGRDHEISVPTHNFKVAISLPIGADPATPSKDWQVISTIFPNVNSDGSDPSVDITRTCADSQSGEIGRPTQLEVNWRNYITTLDEVETRAHLRIFNRIRGSLQQFLGSNTFFRNFFRRPMMH